MSIEIPVAFAQKYHGDFIMLSQQKESRLARTVRTDPDMEGKAGYFDRIGATTAQEATGRHSDTPLVSTPHSRRRIILRDFDISDMIDKKDARRMIHAAQLPSRYREGMVMAMNRKLDDLIIEAANGNAYSTDEDDASATVALPSAQKVAASGGGLTLTKVLSAKEIIDAAEVDPDLPRFAVVTARQVTNMLGTTEVKSSDYNTVKALVEGTLNSFLGFEWIRTQQLTTDSASARLCLFYAMGAIGLARGQEIQTDIGPRRDKRNSVQVYVDFSADATRIEDEKLVQVACTEA